MLLMCFLRDALDGIKAGADFCNLFIERFIARLELWDNLTQISFTSNSLLGRVNEAHQCAE